MNKKHLMIPEVLSALVRAEDETALEFVASAVATAKGNMIHAAEALGVGVRTLYRWRDNVPGLAPLIGAVAMGRTGAAERATKARLKK